MVTARILTFDEEHIRSLTTPVTYDRGFDYYRSNAIFGQIAHGNLLLSYCHGSKAEPYSVQINLLPNGDILGECTCPYNWGGYCKHITATLLKYLYEPETFRSLRESVAYLKERPREELIEIIQSLVEHQPRLLEFVLPSSQANTTAAIPFNLRIFESYLSRLLKEEIPASEIPGMLSSLERIRKEAEQRERHGRKEDAFRIYSLLLQEMISHFSRCEDYDGSLASFILGCLNHATELATQINLNNHDRSEWLRQTYDLLGRANTRFTKGLGELILTTASTTELTLLEHWARQDWEQGLKGKGQYAAEDKQRIVSEFLLEVYDRTGHNKRYLELAHRTGQTVAMARLLLSRGRLEDSLDIAKDFETPSECHVFAEELAARGYFGVAVKIAQRGLGMPGYHLDLIKWLAGLLEKQGHLVPALDLRIKRFFAHPDLESYRETATLAQRLDQWSYLRNRLINHLEKNDNYDLLAEIHLSEGQIDAAVKVAAAEKLYEVVLLKVAREAEKDFPEETLPLYQMLIGNQVEKVERRAYQQAAAYAGDLRNIYRRLGRQNEWFDYIARVRLENRRRPALQDEFAGL